MMPIASSAVGWPAASVPHTVMPRSAAYSRSIEALRMPDVSSSFRSGKLLQRGFEERRALAHHADDREALQRGYRRLLVGERLVEHLHLDVGDRPVGELRGDVLIVVEDRAAVRHVVSLRALRRFFEDAEHEQAGLGLLILEHVAGLVDQVRDVEGRQADRCTRPRAGRPPQGGSAPCGFSARAAGSAVRAGRGWCRACRNGRFRGARRQGRRVEPFADRLWLYCVGAA